MADSQDKSGGSQPPPVTYKNPRRTSPENSITLRYHRLARDAARRNSPTVVPKISFVGSRRNSSGESNDTGVSDAKKWFNRSNENANAVFDSTMDVDPPFYQKETDSSNEDGMKYAVPSQSPAYNFVQSRNQGLVRPGLAHSSSADDYRSVIDDLTVENKKLRDELRRYKQMGPDSLRREKLFEVKVHGLPSRKKRELEAALRDFTTSLDGSSTSASPRAKDKLKAQGKSSMSKHASSSSGSQSRPVPTDSAYASISTGPTSSSASIPGRLVRHGLSEQSVERYLKDIPEGLWPKSTIMTEKDKKKLVVKRLEQLFTGKGSDQLHQQTLSLVPPPISEEVEMRTNNGGIISAEATREAQILPQLSEKISHSRDNVSSNSNGDQSDPKDGGNASGSGSDGPNSNDPPSGKQVPEQRPTRPHDLDPDRIQVPSVNMEYIRHLGLAAPETEAQKRYSSKDVSPDAEGWVYLNLLCNLAQLHMFNVTPAFIRAAVTEKSRQFQLSPDGRKIRWRGGAEGTRFSSESSGSNSPRASEGDTSDGSHGANQRKKQKTVAVARGENDVMITEPSKFGPQVSSSSDSFHYKPLFVHQQSSSSDEQPSFDDETPGSFYGAPEESNFGMNSRWNHSGVSGLSQHQRKRRRDGAIIYYTGAPFCTDLSGDLSEVSPDGSYNNHNLTSLDKKGNSASPAAAFDITAAKAPKLERTTSGSSIPFKPLSNLVSHYAMMDLDFAPPELTPDESYESDDLDAKFPWSDAKEPNISPQLVDFEASGLAGITPEDHFVVSMSTRRP
ncbi:frequency clock protein, partial [Pseudomassariella vexata]